MYIVGSVKSDWLMWPSQNKLWNSTRKHVTKQTHNKWMFVLNIWGNDKLVISQGLITVLHMHGKMYIINLLNTVNYIYKLMLYIIHNLFWLVLATQDQVLATIDLKAVYQRSKQIYWVSQKQWKAISPKF